MVGSVGGEPTKKLNKKQLGNGARSCQLVFFRVCENFFSKIKLLVIKCVKVERRGLYSEGVTPTSCLIYKKVVLSQYLVFKSIYKNGAIGERKLVENNVCRKAVMLLLVKCYDIKRLSHRDVPL